MAARVSRRPEPVWEATLPRRSRARAITGAVVVPAGPDHDPGILVDEEWVTHGFVPADELAALPDTEDLVAVVVTDGPAHDGAELSAGLAGKLSDLRSPWVLQE